MKNRADDDRISARMLKVHEQLGQVREGAAESAVQELPPGPKGLPLVGSLPDLGADCAQVDVAFSGLPMSPSSFSRILTT